MNKAIPTIALVGRTNVGKSTLFNLLAGEELAIVENHHGVTRDRNYITLYNYKHPFTLVDTGGMVGEEQTEMAEAVRLQTEIAIHEADLILAMFDGKDGLHPLDHQVVDALRKSKKKIIWVANKCEKDEHKLRANELYALGVEDLQIISAAHNDGIKQLMKQIWTDLDMLDNEKIELAEDDEKRPLRVAIIGKPNCGKSTFLNKLLGQDRLITSDISGTTRDSINTFLTREGREFMLIDTAGLRRMKNIEEKTLEQISTFRTLRALAMCDVALLFVDATQGEPSDQDAKMAELVHKRGKGLVIVINKWDAIEKDNKTSKQYEETVYDVFRFCNYAPIVFISALTGRRCPAVLQKAAEIFDQAKARISTGDLNRMIGRAIVKNLPPVYRGEPLKIPYVTQTGTRPPTFILFCNNPAKVPDSYVRYLKNTIREHYPFPGYDLKLILKKKTSKQDPE